MIALFIIGFGIPIGAFDYMVYVGFVRKRQAFRALIAGDEAVILRMHGSSIDDRYKTSDELQHFVDRLQWALGNIGEVREVNIADGAATATIFGESAEEIYSEVRKVLRHTSLAKNASVVLRYGPPGSRERRTHMAN